MPIKKIIPKRSSLVKSEYGNEVFALTIWSNIFHWRKYKWFSQEELEKRSWITQATISDIENWEANPTIATLSKLAQALWIPTELTTKRHILWKMLETIDYLTRAIDDIDILKAMKLLYFVDLEFAWKYWNKLTWLDYYRYTYWPFNNDIYEINNVFDKNNNIYSPQKFEKYLLINKEDKKFLDSIIDHYGKLSAIKLKDMSYETEPMQWCTMWGDERMGELIF